MIKRVEQRHSAKMKLFKFIKPPFFSSFLAFKVDESKRGLGCLLIGSQCAGRGERVTLGDSKTYVIRWVKVRFGFFYRLGLEAL